MYELKYTYTFQRRVSKLTKKNNHLLLNVEKTLERLQSDPFHSSLRTHKVNSRMYHVHYSSRVTADTRIIWDFDKGKLVILLIDFGGRSGKNKVYK
ncbi:MAG: type II toxin-antitoxin system mRNA interferase toxin, RelE/StbE family [Candidatus Dojkabacteria bacterium]